MYPVYYGARIKGLRRPTKQACPTATKFFIGADLAPLDFVVGTAAMLKRLDVPDRWSTWEPGADSIEAGRLVLPF